MLSGLLSSCATPAAIWPIEASFSVLMRWRWTSRISLHGHLELVQTRSAWSIMNGRHIASSAMPRCTATALARQVGYPQAPQLSSSSGKNLLVRARISRTSSSVGSRQTLVVRRIGAAEVEAVERPSPARRRPGRAGLAGRDAGAPPTYSPTRRLRTRPGSAD